MSAKTQEGHSEGAVSPLVARLGWLVAGAMALSGAAAVAVAAVPSLGLGGRSQGLHVGIETAATVIAVVAAYLVVGRFHVSGSLRDVSLVGATYGLANRSLGSVGLLGPVRMNYEKALRSVRAAAFELSSFLEEVYAEN